VAADGYVKEERQERPKTAILSLAKKWRRAFLKRLSHVLGSNLGLHLLRCYQKFVLILESILAMDTCRVLIR
jgi:hypothetical protein